MAKVNYDQMATAYEAGRALPAEAVRAWMLTAQQYVPGTREPILDLGAGTGRFSAALAEHFDVPVMAIEPAGGMLRRASDMAHPRVYLAAGVGEAIPCRTGAFQAVWLSQVVHHLDNLQSCAVELRRVLRRRGVVLLRGAFGAAGAHIPVFRYFPGALRIAQSFPTLRSIQDTFGDADLRKIGHEVVGQVIAPSPQALLQRFRLRADSTLQLLPDDEFEEGINRLAHASTSDVARQQVREDIELVAFRAT